MYVDVKFYAVAKISQIYRGSILIWVTLYCRHHHHHHHHHHKIRTEGDTRDTRGDTLQREL